MLWGVIFWSAIVYLVVSPDKTSLAASRGLWGAARGFAKPGHTSSKGGRPGATQGPRGRFAGLLDGWREGIRVARQRRANGKDLWSRGSYLAGRAWGASESIRAGVRRIPAQAAAWRAERAAKKGAPTVQGEVIDPDPMADEPKTYRPGRAKASVKEVRAWVCAPCALHFNKQWSERSLQVPYGRMKHRGDPRGRLGAFFPSELGVVRNAGQVGVDVDANQRCHFCKVSFGQLYPDACPDCAGPYGHFGEHSEENAHRRTANKGPCPKCGIHHLGPRPATSYDEGCDYDVTDGFPSGPADGAWVPYSGQDVVQGEVVAIAPTKDLAADQAAEGAPAEGAGAPSPTPDFTNQHKEIKTMNMQLTELTNVNELDMELEAIAGVLEQTMEGLTHVDEWAKLLPERWEATDYSTKGLDEAIAGIPESFSVLVQSSALLEQIARARKEIKAAQEFGEMADSVGATGNVAGFRAS